MKAQINDHLFRRPADIFEQGMLVCSELRRENVTIVGVAGEGPRPTIRLLLWVTAMLALTPNSWGFGLYPADAFDFRCMQSVELVFVLRLLRADALSPFEGVQLGDGTRR